MLLTFRHELLSQCRRISQVYLIFIFTARDPQRHRQRRKLLSRGFSQAALLEFEPHIAEKIGLLHDHWVRLSKETDKPIDVYPWAHMLGFDVICKHTIFLTWEGK